MERLKASKTALIGDKRYTIAVELIIIFTAGIPALRRLASLPYIVILQFLYVLFWYGWQHLQDGFPHFHHCSRSELNSMHPVLIKLSLRSAIVSVVGAVSDRFVCVGSFPAASDH